MDCDYFYHEGNHSTHVTIASADNWTTVPGGISKTFIAIATSIVYLSSTIANFALIIGLKNTNKKLAISQKLYIYLSSTDAVFSLVVLVSFGGFSLFPINCKTMSIAIALSIYTFGLGLGSFLLISYLRNQAIRKPFKSVTLKTVHLALAGWNVITLSTCLLYFFTYHPVFGSRFFYAFSWSFMGLSMMLTVAFVAILNCWSKKILTRQSSVGISQNEIEMRRRKRNKTAVAILNIISLIYAICLLPFAFFFVLAGLLSWMQEDSVLITVLEASSFIYLPLFPCSGLNALAYMLKDQNIRMFYKHFFCREKRPNL